MANTTSAKKAARQSVTRAARNKGRKSRMRTYVRKVEEAIVAGDQAVALTALRDAEPQLVRSANHGLIHKNTASRKVSRLAARVKAMTAAHA